MNITYEKTKINYNQFLKIDKTKKNILIIGPAINDNKRGSIINPVTLINAFDLYGDSDLYFSYKDAVSITNDTNVYLSNCYATSDYLTLFNEIIQYDFDYIVPIGIYSSDAFYNILTKSYEYYSNYFLNILHEANSLSTLIMTDKHASLYSDIDNYLNDMNNKYYNYINTPSTLKIISTYGFNLVITFNMLQDVAYSNVILSSMLSINNSYNYPNPISFKPIFNFDNNDIKNSNYVYFKFNYPLDATSAENLLNFRTIKDVYKNILINELIRSILKILDLNDFKGKLFTNYIKLQILTKIKTLLNPYINKLFKNYNVSKVGFIKDTPGSGVIYIELSIIPFGLIENVNIVMEV